MIKLWFLAAFVAMCYWAAVVGYPMWLHNAQNNVVSWTVLCVDVVDFEKLPNVLILLVDNAQKQRCTAQFALLVALVALAFLALGYLPFYSIYLVSFNCTESC